MTNSHTAPSQTEQANIDSISNSCIRAGIISNMTVLKTAMNSTMCHNGTINIQIYYRNQSINQSEED